ncbi:hypothetical protein [Psychromonas aquimarina]|uniref:hypothetical protein n=1 Tax=Psychromonas aquimarina TaxID=444919 RepID=UPI00048C84D3|nr:hypothetical protein [Psychromonas aquimarina]
MDNFEIAISASKNLTSNDGNGHRVVNHHPEYLNGQLYVIAFEHVDGETYHNYVYIESGKTTVCKNPALLNELVSRKSKKAGLESFISNIGGVAGIIGLIITLTIVWLVVKDPYIPIPQVLSAALTTILGFYFGSKVKK